MTDRRREMISQRFHKGTNPIKRKSSSMKKGRYLFFFLHTCSHSHTNTQTNRHQFSEPHYLGGKLLKWQKCLMRKRARKKMVKYRNCAWFFLLFLLLSIIFPIFYLCPFFILRVKKFRPGSVSLLARSTGHVRAGPFDSNRVVWILVPLLVTWITRVYTWIFFGPFLRWRHRCCSRRPVDNFIDSF